MGSVRPPDEYKEWMSGAAAFKREFPDELEVAFDCYNAWSACSSKYGGNEATRRKFDEVPTDYEGVAAPVTINMLHWRARHRHCEGDYQEHGISVRYQSAAQEPTPTMVLSRA